MDAVQRDAARARRLKRKYGLTIAQYNGMLRQQKGRCAICRSLPGTRRLAVDHDHATKRVRGLLCWQCNTGLQRFGDDVMRILNAVRYLWIHWR